MRIPRSCFTPRASLALKPQSSQRSSKTRKPLRAIETDREHARALQVRSIPTLIVCETGTRLVNGPREDLAAQLRAALRLVARKEMP